VFLGSRRSLDDGSHLHRIEVQPLVPLVDQDLDRIVPGVIGRLVAIPVTRPFVGYVSRFPDDLPDVAQSVAGKGHRLTRA
ncbi:MAG: hypothetical protein EBZ89_13725, partial [Chloroflexi bacterium]|nr:hypothetical protein [Chloroflexota bacterium]